MLILKQNAANTVPTPPAGKGTIFLNPNDDLAVKTADGNITVFPTAGGANTQVYFNDEGSFGATANFTFNSSTNVLTVTGNVAATRVLTDNLLYANGTAWDLSDPGGSNTQIQFNDDEGFGGSAALTFDKSSNLVTVAANLNANNLNATTHITSGNVWANSGTIGAQTLKGEGGNISNIQGANVSGAVASATSAGSATTAGTVTTAAQPNITSVGTLSSLTVTGNASAGNINAGNLLTANYVAGTLTTAAQPNITSVGTLTSVAVTGNVTAGNVYANSGTIGAQTLKGEGGNISNIQGANVSGAVASATSATSATTAGTVTTAAQPNITSVGTLSSLSVTGNVAAGNLTTTGVLTVSGTGVSSIAGNLDMTSNNIINLATPNDPNDAATKQYVDDVAQGLHTHDSCGAATPDTLANITGGTITYNNGTAGVGANLVTTGSFNLIDGVNVQSAGTRILVKNEANSAHNGIYVWSNATVITRATDFDTSTEMAGGDFTFVTAGTLYDNTGWVMTDAVTTVGTSPVPWVQFSGAGTYTAGTGLTLNGSQFSVNASQTQVTAVGTLTTLDVSGNANVGNLGTTKVVATGNVEASYFIGNGSQLTGIDATAIQNGTANVRTFNNANVTVSAAGNANVVVVTGTGVNVAGTLNATGNANVGNLGFGAGTITGTGNVNAGNMTLTGALNAGGRITANSSITMGSGNIIVSADSIFNQFTLGGTDVSLGTGGNILFQKSGSEIARFSTGGNLGLGNAAPTDRLSVTGNAAVSGNITAANVISTAYQVSSVAGAVSAAGTVQGNATAITSQINVVSTVASGTGVILPNVPAGVRITIVNTSANALLVYPASGENINSLAANAAYSQPAGSRLDYVSTSATQYYTLNATYG